MAGLQLYWDAREGHTWVGAGHAVLRRFGFAVAGEDGALLRADHELGGAGCRGALQGDCSHHGLPAPLLHARQA